MPEWADKARNEGEQLKGTAKEKLGKATKDRDLQAQGKKDKAKGSVKEAADKIKDVFRD